MKSKTVSQVFSASKSEVFDYFSKIENLPKWATEFCKELKKVDGKYKVVTPTGELFVHFSADKKTGVIDLFAGPAEDQMALAPTRVVEIADGQSVYLFTFFQAPDVSDEVFEGQLESLKKELAHAKIS